MKQPVILDYIIVGQGLAGSAVAIQLLKKGKKILVIDEPHRNHSSRPAAGLFNPITGKKPAKTWMADTLFPHLHQYYQEVEALTGEKFFFPKGMYRPFATIAEQNEWMGKSSEATFTPYIEKISSDSLFNEEVKDPFGGLMLRQCGYINTSIYLDAIRKYVTEKGTFLSEHFDETALRPDAEGVSYKDFRASAVIFCQGVHALSENRFKSLPVRPLKGEIINIKTDWKKDVILNRGVYMVPGTESGVFRVGSTYASNDISEGGTEEGQLELEQKLKALVHIPYEVLSQDWGIRPTTPDRRPLLGNHPESDRLIIFNGLGTKGVSLAPYFSEVLIRWLENPEPLNKDVTLTRFK